MESSTASSNSVIEPNAKFALTRWSVVLAAGRSDSAHARDALEELCRTYWPPIYAFIRRNGHGPEDAQDLAQEFFARLLEKKFLASVDPAKGRFRSFLLASVKHFLANEWDKATAQKRGGRARLLAFNETGAEALYASEAAEQLTPDKVFERRWALTLLDRVLRRLRDEYNAEDKTRQFEALKPALVGDRQSLGYAELAVSLGTSEGAVKVAVYRLRQRYRKLLRDEIAQTVAIPDEVDDEIRALFGALEG